MQKSKKKLSYINCKSHNHISPRYMKILPLGCMVITEKNSILEIITKIFLYRI